MATRCEITRCGLIGLAVLTGTSPVVCCLLIRLWLPAHRDAGKIAGGFWTAALTFLGAAVTLKETDKTGWRVCLGLMGLFLVGAAVATVFACTYNIEKARKRGATRPQGGEPSRDAADMA